MRCDAISAHDICTAEAMRCDVDSRHQPMSADVSRCLPMSADVCRCQQMSADVSRCLPMSVEAMSVDFMTRRCEAMSIAGHTSMPDDVMQFDASQAAVAGDSDAERK